MSFSSQFFATPTEVRQLVKESREAKEKEIVQRKQKDQEQKLLEEKRQQERVANFASAEVEHEIIKQFTMVKEILSEWRYENNVLDEKYILITDLPDKILDLIIDTYEKNKRNFQLDQYNNISVGSVSEELWQIITCHEAKIIEIFKNRESLVEFKRQHANDNDIIRDAATNFVHERSTPKP